VSGHGLHAGGLRRKVPRDWLRDPRSGQVRTRKALAAVLAVGVAVTAGACGGGSSEAERSTPSGAPTVVNSAPQTVDEQGNPVQTTPPSTGGGTTTTTGGGTTTGGAAPTGDATAGKQVFTSSGCGGCHTLSEAGASGAVGPNLDQALQGKTPDYIRESIIDPNKDIAPGFSPNIMPSNYGQSLQPKQIDDLVALLYKP
jgi:mono/diheme cytochrome c family protein